MLEQVLNNLNNWFEREILRGEFTISGGSLLGTGVRDRQFYRIIGSTFNDGLYRHPAPDLADETFTGEIWLLGVPEAVVSLAEEIETWCEGRSAGEFASESFGGYSYSRMTDTDGSPMSWQGAYRAELNRWRKI